MKKIIYAWIEQVLDFDSEEEVAMFKQDLRANGKKYLIQSCKKNNNGKFRIHVLKQYNNNHFPEGGES